MTWSHGGGPPPFLVGDDASGIENESDVVMPSCQARSCDDVDSGIRHCQPRTWRTSGPPGGHAGTYEIETYQETGPPCWTGLCLDPVPT